MNILAMSLFAFVLLEVAPVQAATIFSENFEVALGEIKRSPANSANFNELIAKGWNATSNVLCGAYCAASIVNAPPGRTGRVLRYEYRGQNAFTDEQMSMSRTFADQEVLFERWWARFEPIDPTQPSSFIDGGGSMKLHYYNPAGTDPVSFVVGAFQGCPNTICGGSQLPFTIPVCPSGSLNNPGCTYPANINGAAQPFNTWVCMETEIRMNTIGQADGAFRLWRDGVLMSEHTGLTWRQPDMASSKFRFLQVYRQAANNLYRYEDDFVLATARVGCGLEPPPPSDTQAPSIPAGLSAQAASSSQINLTWNASSDNVGVAGYRILRAGAQVATTAGTSYSDSGLAASTTYSYTVAAYDAAGNVSAQYSAASATTQAAAPSVATPGAVTNLSASASDASSVNLSFTQVDDGTGQPAKYDIRYQSPSISWGAAASVAQGTCAVPLAGTQIGATKTCTVLGLSSSTDYQFQLVSFRGTMNAGAVFGPLSNVAGARTAAAQPAADIQPPAKPRNLRMQ